MANYEDIHLDDGMRHGGLVPSRQEREEEKLRQRIAELEDISLLHECIKLRDRIAEFEAALIEIRQGQQPCDYAKPLVTIDRLVAVATEALEKTDG